jgi:2-oxoglutarate ferredoxin oxidoreductase subunit delta
MYCIKIDRDRCKSCGLCIKFCPKNLLAFDDPLNARGVKPAQYTGAEEECIGCGSCAAMCPDACIEIAETEEVEA